MYELTNPQKAFYMYDRLGVGKAATLTGSVILPRRIETAELQRAANEVLRINDGLRTCFVEKDGTVYQDIKAFEERSFDVLRFNSKEELDEWGRGYAMIPLKLDIRSEGPGLQQRSGSKPSAVFVANMILDKAGTLMRRAKYGLLHPEAACFELRLVELPDACGAILKMHHVAADAWSMVLVANQFIRILNGETPKAYSYEEYIRSEEEYRKSKRYERDRAFFEEQKQRLSERTKIWPGVAKSLRASRRTVEVDRELTKRIEAYAAAHDQTPYTLFLTAMCIYAGRRLGKDRFYVGSVVINRVGYREKNTAGLFVNAVPLLIDICEDESFAETNARVRDVNFAGYRHEKGCQDNDTTNMIYDLWMSYQNAKLDADESAVCTQYYGNCTSSVKTFTVEDRSADGYFKLHFDHNEMVPESVVDELFEVLLAVLSDGIADDSRPIRELGK